MFRDALVCGAAGLVLLLAGCAKNSDEPVRYRVSGQVLFEGQPVPFGSVVFDPDSSRGSSGAQGAARIVNGRYDTSLEGGKGVIGGPVLVTVSGRSVEFALEGEDPGVLFSDYVLQEDFPKEDIVFDIEVPAEMKAAPR